MEENFQSSITEIKTVLTINPIIERTILSVGEMLRSIWLRIVTLSSSLQFELQLKKSSPGRCRDSLLLLATQQPGGDTVYCHVENDRRHIPIVVNRVLRTWVKKLPACIINSIEQYPVQLLLKRIGAHLESYLQGILLIRHISGRAQCTRWQLLCPADPPE